MIAFMPRPTLKDLEALVADPSNAPLLARILAAPSRPVTPEEREILAAPLSRGAVLMSTEEEPE